MEQDNTTQNQNASFDADAFLARMNESIKESLANQPQPQFEPPPAPAPDETRDFLNPYLKPVADQANFAAAAAMDYTKFYSKNRVVPNGEEDILEGTISAAMESEIEKTFEDMARQGKPASREEIRNYLLGRDLTKDPKGFADKQSKRRQLAVERARQGSDVGAMGSVAQMTPEQLRSMDSDELGKALENYTF